MNDPHASDSNKLSALVEMDFDRNRLLVLMEEEPQDSLYRSVYKALYSPSTPDGPVTSVSRYETTLNRLAS